MARSPSSAILLVDGYNIVGAWPELVSLKAEKGYEAARQQLTEDLANYSAFKGFETWLVFDAYAQPTASSQEAVTPQLSVHYTHFGQTADSYIERACAQFRHDSRKFRQRLIVATSDRVHRQTVIGYGAEWMSATQLQRELMLAMGRVRRRQKSSKGRAGRLLGSLDPEAQSRLRQLRMGLPD
ncbi:NYN domain-containing protein [Romeria aff. gracilis LEGE 07310]|uniref:NYN domain-containing protein n=1 Tax=Vasconcelosia minhoensis LEGE 07310 TaxID=915328 RepID=A0A8J7DDB6_9CYAN|nr:NYN domain-containing protein [Romeria gracilis]MBE9078593.1 NYN domain-containing protein [Romeria aff. gracilis LEGE 07310]